MIPSCDECVKDGMSEIENEMTNPDLENVPDKENYKNCVCKKC